MATTISDNGATITITVDALPPNDVNKESIINVTIIKTNIIRLDIGQGPLRNIFVPYADVTSPVTANPAALRDAIQAMRLVASSGSGSATEAKQLDEIAAINTLNGNVLQLTNITTASIDNPLNDPLFVDESGANVVYYGYGAIGAKQNEATIAIKRVQRVGEVNFTTWANGNKNFTNIWTNREALTYQ